MLKRCLAWIINVTLYEVEAMGKAKFFQWLCRLTTIDCNSNGLRKMGVMAPFGQPSSHLSGASALSCQRRSSRWLSKVSSRKITMPVAEIRAKAANMRGILSW